MNKAIFGVLGIMALMVVGLVASVSAYRGYYSVHGPHFNEDRHEAMEKAFDKIDYDAWYNLMTEDGRHPRVVDIVTEDNFETFVLAHEAGENGDDETAAELRAELGLNNGIGPKDGSGQCMGRQGSRGKMSGQGTHSSMGGQGMYGADCDGTEQKIDRRR